MQTESRVYQRSAAHTMAEEDVGRRRIVQSCQQQQQPTLSSLCNG